MEFQENRHGHNVKITAAKPITDPAERFAAYCTEQDGGLTTPCRIWNGSVSFCIDSETGETMAFRRAAVKLAGEVLPNGYFRPKMICGNKQCVELSHMQYSVNNIT